MAHCTAGTFAAAVKAASRLIHADDEDVFDNGHEGCRSIIALERPINSIAEVFVRPHCTLRVILRVQMHERHDYANQYQNSHNDAVELVQPARNTFPKVKCSAR